MKSTSLKLLAAAALAVGLSAVNTARADALLTGHNIGNGVGILVTVNPNGSLTVNNTGNGAYDGADDTLVQVNNNSHGYVKSLGVSGNFIMGFDGADGIGDFTGLAGDPLALGAPNPYGGNGHNSYASPDGYFYVADYNNGTALWYGLGITPGGTDYFSLEESPSIGGATFNNVVITHAPDGGSSAVLLGGAVLGLGLLRRRF